MSTVRVDSRLAFLSSCLTCVPDNLQVQWGPQDSYEIIRKVGRGKYSEVRGLQSYVVTV